MSRSEVEILTRGRDWQTAGERVVLATVAHTWGSSPRQPGALMVLGESGRFAGSVSGGCIESELVARIRDSFPTRFETVEYRSDTSRTLPCGGRLLLTLEPLAELPDLDGMLAALAAGQAVERRLDLAAGTATWSLAGPEARTALDDTRLAVVYEPAWRLVVVGTGELASWVCRFASLLDYELAVCDPRPEYREGWVHEQWPASAEFPDDFIAARDCDAHTAIVALTHDPKVDDLAMMEALRTPAFYIGALGSRGTTAKRAARLVEHFDMSAAEVARIRGPIGIDLHTRKPAEIALAVVTDITAVRNGVAIDTTREAR